MNITDETLDGAAVVHLEGNLDTTTAPDVMAHLDGLIEAWEARLLRVKLSNLTAMAPTDDEIRMLTARAGDPLVSRVASRLVTVTSGDDREESAAARIALRELHAACTTD